MARNALLAVGLIAVLHLTGVLSLTGLYDSYTRVNAWQVAHQNDVLFYHKAFLEAYPVLWVLFPLAAAIAIQQRRDVALFCLIPLAICIALQSLAGRKSPRYFHYAMPFFFVKSVTNAWTAFSIWSRSKPSAPRIMISVVRAGRLCPPGRARPVSGLYTSAKYDFPS